MYEKHDQLNEVKDGTILWKHMNLSRFLAVLVNGSLWFNRLDNFEDVYEGTFPLANAQQREQHDNGEVPAEQTYKQIERLREQIYVSCFHANRYESAAMWSLYSKEEGIAIKTTGKRLKEALTADKKTIYMSGVTYIDFEKDFMPEGNIIYLATHKRKSFEHEKEVRCIFVDDIKEPAYKDKKGIDVQVYLDTLLMEIFISPYAPAYTKDTLEEVLSRFDLKAKVTASTLYSK